MNLSSNFWSRWTGRKKLECSVPLYYPCCWKPFKYVSCLFQTQDSHCHFSGLYHSRRWDTCSEHVSLFTTLSNGLTMTKSFCFYKARQEYSSVKLAQLQWWFKLNSLVSKIIHGFLLIFSELILWLWTLLYITSWNDWPNSFSLKNSSFGLNRNPCLLTRLTAVRSADFTSWKGIFKHTICLSYFNYIFSALLQYGNILQ